METTNNLERYLVVRIGRVMKEMNKRANHFLQHSGFDIQFEQLPPLMMTYFRGEVSQQEIADELDRDKSSIQRTITWLEKKGYVSVTQDASDKRRNVIRVSRLGKVFAKAIHEHMEALNTEMMNELTEEEIRVMDKVFKKITAVIERK